MKRALITLIVAGGLMVPAGLALAQDDTVEPTEPTPTCPEPQHDWERIHQQVPAGEQHQARNQHRLGDGTCDGDCDGDQIHDRDQTRLDDGTVVADQIRDRDQTRREDGTCDGDCTGDQVRDRDQTHVEDDTGNGPGNDPGRGPRNG